MAKAKFSDEVSHHHRDEHPPSHRRRLHLSKQERLGPDSPEERVVVPANARVLEVGCNDGSNLLPMAASLPDARFVGCDVSASAIAAAREGASAVGLRNVSFEMADLASFDGGRFDYIVAHGG